MAALPLAAEWKELKKSLLQSQLDALEKCFYCGVLMVCAQFASGRLTPAVVDKWDKEIRSKLRKK